MGRPSQLCAAVAALVALVCAQPGEASDYPTKPVKIIAPVQPGGGVDLVGRTVAEQLSRSMNNSFVVENLSGGGGVIAAQNVARAAPDGYTLMVGYVATHGTNPAVRKVPYDPIAEFTPIAMVGGTPNVLSVHPAVPAKSLEEFVVYAKRNAGKLVIVAVLILVMRLFDLFWTITPAFTHEHFHISWMDIVAPIGIGGLWLAVFTRALAQRPLIPINDPQYESVLEQKHAHAGH